MRGWAARPRSYTRRAKKSATTTIGKGLRPAWNLLCVCACENAISCFSNSGNINRISSQVLGSWYCSRYDHLQVEVDMPASMSSDISAAGIKPSSLSQHSSRTTIQRMRERRFDHTDINCVLIQIAYPSREKESSPSIHGGMWRLFYDWEAMPTGFITRSQNFTRTSMKLVRKHRQICIQLMVRIPSFCTPR